MTDNTEDREEEEKSGRFSGLVSRFRGSSDDEPGATEADKTKSEEATADAPEEGASDLFGRLKSKLSRSEGDDGGDVAEQAPTSDEAEDGSKGLLGRLKAKVTRSDGTDASEEPEPESLDAEEQAGEEAEDEGEIELTDEPLVAETTTDEAGEPVEVESVTDEPDDADVAVEVERDDEEPADDGPDPGFAPETVAPKALDSPPPTAPVLASGVASEIDEVLAAEGPDPAKATGPLPPSPDGIGSDGSTDATPRPPELAEPEPVRPTPAAAGNPATSAEVRQTVEAALERRRGSPPRLLRTSSGDR